MANYWLGKRHTEETKKKIGDAHRGKIVSIETRKKIGASSKGRWKNEEERRKCVPKNPRCCFEKGHVMSEESRRKMSISRTGVPCSEERRKAISESNKGKMRSRDSKEKMSRSAVERMKVFGRKFRRFKYGDIWMRSSWEVKIASRLTELGFEWEYEPVAFPCCGWKHYVPDFFIHGAGVFLEVKGVLMPDDVVKMSEFVRCGNRLVFVDDVEDLRLDRWWIPW